MSQTITYESELDLEVVCSDCGRSLDSDLNCKRGNYTLSVALCEHCIKLKDEIIDDRDKEIEDLNDKIETLLEEIEALKINNTFSILQKNI